MKLKDIKNHPWFLQTTETSLRTIYGIKVGMHAIPFDPEVLAQLRDYNEDSEETRKYLENNRHNHSITVYYLLMKKQLRSGTQSEFDICSPEFDPTNLKKTEKVDGKAEKSESTNPN